MAVNRTYSDADIVRIFCQHLTKKEKQNVLLFFLSYFSLFIIKSDLAELLSFLPATRLITRALRLLLRVFDLTGSFESEILAGLFQGKMFKEVVKCVDKELSK